MQGSEKLSTFSPQSEATLSFEKLSKNFELCGCTTVQFAYSLFRWAISSFDAWRLPHGPANTES